MRLSLPALAILSATLTLPMAMAQDAPPFATYDAASEAVLNDPHDLAFGPDGMLYIADKFGNRIVVMDPETLEIRRTLFEGQLFGVHDVSFGPNGHAAVAVTGLSDVIVFELAALQPRPLRKYASINTEGALYHTNGRIYALGAGDGQLVAYEGETAVATTGGLFGAHDVAEAPDGSIWVADNFARRLVKYDTDLNQLQVLDHAKYGFIGPRYLDIDAFGRLIIADQDAHRILLIDPDGPDGGTLLGVLGDGSPGRGPGKFDDPEGVVTDGARYWFADSDNNRIVRYVVVTN